MKELGVGSAAGVNRSGDFGCGAENQAVQRFDRLLAEADVAIRSDPAVDHSTGACVSVHVGLHHLADRHVGGRQQLAALLIHDAADAGSCIGAERKQSALVRAAVGSKP